MATKKEYVWATGPLKLIPTPSYTASLSGEKTDRFTHAATMMAQVHNCFIRALNATYHLAPKVPHHRLKDFVAYCDAIVKVVHFHHDEEEVYVFPEVERVTGVVGVMEGNVRGHEAFHSQLGKFGGYLGGLIETGREGEFSTRKFRALFEAFAQPLQEHLQDEIQSILALRAYSHTPLDLMKAAQQAAQKSMSLRIMVSQLPGLLLNHDRTFEDSFEPGFWPRDVPAVMHWVVRRVCSCWYWGRWEFTACDGGQMPKELPYLDLPDREDER